MEMMSTMPECPKCGTEVEEPMKTWEMKSPRANTTTLVELFNCSKCGNKFRKAKKLEEEDQ